MPDPVTVLLVEDDEPLRGLLRFWLEDNGLHVVEAGDGAEALAIVLEAAPDLIVTDAMMPNMSGDELVERLKGDEALSHIPIIMATAAASPFRTQRMLERGCTAVLGKPLDEGSFLQAVTEALGRR